MNILNFDFRQFMTIDKLVTMIRLLVLLVIGIPSVYFLSKWVRKYVTRKYSQQQAMIFSKLVLYLGLFIIIFSILNEFGFKLTHLLGAAGIIGIAVGFASQTSVSNIISGLFLFTEQPFKIGDVITAQNITGVVLSIDIFSVKLRTFDNRFIRIPNETMIKSDVTNVTYFPIRRVDLNISIAYKEDIGSVRELLLDVARQNPLCLNEPEPLVIFSGFGASSIDLLFVAWATREDWLLLKNSLAEDVKRRFDQEGVEFPFPHLSLYSGSGTKPMPIRISGLKSTGGKLSGKIHN